MVSSPKIGRPILRACSVSQPAISQFFSCRLRVISALNCWKREDGEEEFAFTSVAFDCFCCCLRCLIGCIRSAEADAVAVALNFRFLLPVILVVVVVVDLLLLLLLVALLTKLVPFRVF